MHFATRPIAQKKWLFRSVTIQTKGGALQLEWFEAHRFLDNDSGAEGGTVLSLTTTLAERESGSTVNSSGQRRFILLTSPIVKWEEGLV